MNPERLHQVSELYHAALELKPGDRVELLAKADPELRQEVESLLAQAGDGLLDRPAWERVSSLLADDTVTQLAAGTELGPYRIEALIGAGGMGQVFRAVDTRLGRKVALKTCQAEFSARFEREARAISALNHPNICTLHDIGPNYLVMELLEGPTLAERLKQGLFPLELTLRYGAQIAGALAAAHDQGITHRDLKPANIMVTKAGVKVLDFGLAKSPQDENLTASRVVVGTPAYMAPEQREGMACDARTDIYALGLVLYEMATGKRFHTDQTPRIDSIPPHVSKVIESCLIFDRDARWQSAHDLKMELDWASQAEPARSQRKPLALWGAVGLAAALVLAVVVVTSWRSTVSPLTPQTVRYQVRVPEGVHLAGGGGFSLSPDGRTLVYVASKSDGVLRLWAQPIDSLEPRLLPGTEILGADSPPFWSPDSRFLAFYSGEKLRKTDLIGSPAQTICTTPGILLGGSWNRDGVMIFGRDTGGLMRVSEKGGEAIPLTTLDQTRAERVHGFPALLPDGRHFIYSRFSTISENSGVYVGSLDAQPAQQGLKRLIATPTAAQFIPQPNGNGRLLFLRDGTLWSQDLDTSRLDVTGEPIRVAEHVGNYLGSSFFAASAGGPLVYRSLEAHLSTLTWFDRRGKSLGSVGAPVNPESPLVLSPDGTQVAMARFDGHSINLWMYDLARDVSQPLTSGSAMDTIPIWSHDGKRIAFSSGRAGRNDLYAIAANGESPEQLLYQSPENKYPTSWSLDGRFLLYDAQANATNEDIWVLQLSGPGKYTPLPLVRTRANESSGTFSPDARWIAYVSDDSGTAEVYVQPFAASGDSLGGPKTLVSRGGGARPRWRADGKELFYNAPDGTLMSVAVAAGTVFQPGIPQALFHAPSIQTWDAAADGDRFLLAIQAEQQAPQPFTIVLGWQLGLTK